MQSLTLRDGCRSWGSFRRELLARAHFMVEIDIVMKTSRRARHARAPYRPSPIGGGPPPRAGPRPSRVYSYTPTRAHAAAEAGACLRGSVDDGALDAPGAARSRPRIGRTRSDGLGARAPPVADRRRPAAAHRTLAEPRVLRQADPRRRCFAF